MTKHHDTPRLTAAQAASRLRVKRETLYAYVSRGLLVSERADDGSSTFDPLDVEALAASRSRDRSGTTGDRGRGMPGRPLMVLDSDVTLIADDELYFRGRRATELAARLPFEAAVDVLWNAPGAAFVSERRAVAAVRRASGALGPEARLIDRLSLAVTVCGSWHEGRERLEAAAVREAGRHMIATMVDSLDDLWAPPSAAAPIAERLWSKLSARGPSADELRLLNATMVLCLDHDLAISTMAARVAASSRATPYAAVAAALNSFDSALHGAASIAAADMIDETMRTGNAERALAGQLVRAGTIAGFGHLVYRNDDPRARLMLSIMRPMARFRDTLAAVDRLRDVVASRSPRPANLDLALAALVVGAGLRRDAGEVTFAVSRTAGWIAHIVDEYDREALRLRPESRYTGRRPAR